MQWRLLSSSLWLVAEIDIMLKRILEVFGRWVNFAVVVVVGVVGELQVEHFPGN